MHTAYAARHSERERLARFLDAVDRRDGKLAASLFTPGSTLLYLVLFLYVCRVIALKTTLFFELLYEDGTWDTGTPVFGVVSGHAAIQELIESKLPPNGETDEFRRHRFADPAKGLRVIGSNGQLSDFEVLLDQNKIKRLTRRDTPNDS